MDLLSTGKQVSRISSLTKRHGKIDRWDYWWYSRGNVGEASWLSFRYARLQLKANAKQNCPITHFGVFLPIAENLGTYAKNDDFLAVCKQFRTITLGNILWRTWKSILIYMNEKPKFLNLKSQKRFDGPTSFFHNYEILTIWPAFGLGFIPMSQFVFAC